MATLCKAGFSSLIFLNLAVFKIRAYVKSSEGFMGKIKKFYFKTDCKYHAKEIFNEETMSFNHVCSFKNDIIDTCRYCREYQPGRD